MSCKRKGLEDDQLGLRTRDQTCAKKGCAGQMDVQVSGL